MPFQLTDPKVQKMAAVLEAKNSSYTPTLKNVFHDCVAGTVKVCKRLRTVCEV
jgi:hypothetical protein